MYIYIYIRYLSRAHDIILSEALDCWHCNAQLYIDIGYTYNL